MQQLPWYEQPLQSRGCTDSTVRVWGGASCCTLATRTDVQLCAGWEVKVLNL